MPYAFEELQQQLGPALAANRQGSQVDHVMIALPSYSVSESILSHYGNRIPSLEHRYLNALLIAGRIPSCEIVYISSRRPEPEVFDYYLSLIPPSRRELVRRRIHLVEVDDGTPRSVASRMLDRADLIARITGLIAGRPALIEPWNVTDHEVALAVALQVPINGTSPELRPLAFKSAGRRLFATAGVPTPPGREDVRSVADVVAAMLEIRADNPATSGIVIKHDDSGAGDGNVVIDLTPMDAMPDPVAWLAGQIESLPEWYRNDLASGGVVEALIGGDRFTSPSAQVDILPDGRVVVLATHEQVLGGPSGQVYLGCRFPADPAYAPLLAAHAVAVGERLASQGALGRFSVDFVAAGDGAGNWQVFAIEVNLRKGGTTHPYAALRNVVPGRYDPDLGRWLGEDGSARYYNASDNLVDDAWLGLAPGAVIRAVADAGLEFDLASGTGVVLHMLAGLAIDGRFGLTAIGRTPDEATMLDERTRQAVTGLARTTASGFRSAG